MDPSPTAPDEARYVLGVSATVSPFAQRIDAELALSDAGISYGLDGRSGLRPYAGLTGIRLQQLSPKPWLGVIELSFATGLPLVVSSNPPGNEPSPERSRAFVAFVRDLHRRLTPEDRKRIAFRRGIAPIRHRIVTIGVAAMIAPLLFVFWLLLTKGAPADTSLWPIMIYGVFVAGFVNLARTTRPRPYDPDQLPQDLVPPLG